MVEFKRLATTIQPFGAMYAHFLVDTVPKLAMLRPWLTADPDTKVQKQNVVMYANKKGSCFPKVRKWQAYCIVNLCADLLSRGDPPTCLLTKLSAEAETLQTRIDYTSNLGIKLLPYIQAPEMGCPYSMNMIAHAITNITHLDTISDILYRH